MSPDKQGQVSPACMEAWNLPRNIHQFNPTAGNGRAHCGGLPFPTAATATSPTLVLLLTRDCSGQVAWCVGASSHTPKVMGLTPGHRCMWEETDRCFSLKSINTSLDEDYKKDTSLHRKQGLMFPTPRILSLDRFVQR